MPTELAKELHRALATARHAAIMTLDDLETRFPWPGQPRQLWPFADISGTLRSGERFLVEVDEHADPTRSVVKYWPLLHSILEHHIDHPPLALVEVSRPDATFGLGFHLLARFVGEQLEEMYVDNFRFEFIELTPEDMTAMAKRVLAFLGRRQGEPTV